MQNRCQKSAFVLLVVLLFMPLMSGAQTYLWPTDASRVMTSSFGEYRPGHFHAGIDFSTWGQTGYRVVAIGDGYISRISVSPYGYGRAIYLKLDSGETVVYGHLSKFNSKIERIVEFEQRRKGLFSIQKYFERNELCFKAGDLLAYTGQTGVGVPHLHFEMRDAANRPINPLLKGYEIADSKTPIVTGVSFTPLDGFSQINGDYKPIVVRPKFQTSGHYVLSKPIVISGNVGLGVSAYDQADGASNRVGVYLLELFVNETLVFSSKYDRFSYDVTSHLVLDRDFRLEARGYGRFYKLYRDLGNKVDLYSCNQPLCGALSFTERKASPEANKFDSLTMFSEGAHQLIVKLWDFSGNLTTVEGTIIASKVPLVELVLLHQPQTESMLGEVHTSDGQILSRANVDVSRNGGSTWYPIANLTRDAGGGSLSYADSSSIESSFTFPIKMTNSNTGSTLLRVTAQNLAGVQSHPTYAVFHYNDSLAYEELRFELDKDYYDNYVRFDIKTSVPVLNTPVLQYWEADRRTKTAPVHQIDLQRFVSSLPLNPGQTGAIPLEISARDLQGRQSFQKQALHLNAVPLGAKRRVRSDDGQCQVEFTATSLFRDMYVRIFSEPAQGTDRFEVATRSYIIEPRDVPMNKGAWVRIKYNPADPDPSKLGIYFWKPTKGWRFLDNKRDAVLSAISGRVKSFGTYTLVRDTTPPQILSLQPASGSRQSLRTPTLKAKFRDELSGISGEDNMILRLDGVRVIAEYDPEQLLLFYKVGQSLSSGQHQVSLLVRDRCGNEAQRTHTFWVE